jgi:8-oxo-dGTP diphosphatase
MSIGRYYGGVAAVIYSAENGKYLLLRRAGDKDYAPGAWECVTGRLDQGEGYEDALHREAREEIGIDVHLQHILGTTHFYRGEHTTENELVGVVYLCSVDDPTAVQISEEHSEFRWLSAQDAIELLNTAETSAQWAKGVIQRSEAVRPMLSSELVTFQGETGFELG